MSPLLGLVGKIKCHYTCQSWNKALLIPSSVRFSLLRADPRERNSKEHVAKLLRPCLSLAVAEQSGQRNRGKAQGKHAVSSAEGDISSDQ